MDESLTLPLAREEVAALGEGARPLPGWSNPYLASKIPKVENGAFDLEFGSGAGFEDQDLRIDEFTRGDGLHDAEDWTTTASLPGLEEQTFNSTHLSASPESSDTTTTPPGSLERAHRGPRLSGDLLLPSGEGLGAGAEDLWSKRMDDFEGKLNENHESLHLRYPTLDGSLTSAATLPPLRSLPAVGHGFPFSPNAPLYGGQLTSYLLQNPQQVPLGKEHSSPPPTAASTSSSGSSTPFVGANMFDHNSAGWRAFNTSAAEYYPEWNMGTCDPRGITTQKYELPTMHEAEQALLMPLSSTPHLTSTAHTDVSVVSEPQDAKIRRVRGRPRRSESVVDVSYVTTGVDITMPYRPKKKSADESAVMGLEDIDEMMLQFTSRQDAKPTRTLRRQCFNCRTWRDVSAWRRSVMQAGHIVCNKCGLYEKAHKKARPLNERGEFVRPGKHVAKAAARGVGRVQPKSRGDSVAGAGVLKFETDGGAAK